MNDINDDIKDSLMALLKRTNDDFGVTLSGNPIPKEIIEQMQAQVVEVQNAKLQADGNQSIQADPYLGLKRITF
jgi:hypothetical protein